MSRTITIPTEGGEFSARHGIDADVAYHGGDSESYLGESRGARAPLPMHLADEDSFISRDAQARINHTGATTTRKRRPWRTAVPMHSPASI